MMLTQPLSKVTESLRLTIAALGFINLGHSGHLHAHLLLIEKRGQPLNNFQRSFIDLTWKPLQAETKPIHDLHGVSHYTASYKHLAAGKEVELFSY
jgi:hypothetical protein